MRGTKASGDFVVCKLLVDDFLHLYISLVEEEFFMRYYLLEGLITLTESIYFYLFVSINLSFRIEMSRIDV